MKRIITLAACLSIILLACAFDNKNSKNQYFQGKVTYSISIVPNSEDCDTNRIRKSLGDFFEFYFKDGNYRQVSHNATLIEEIYLQKENRAYFKKNNSDTLHWIDYSIYEPAITSFHMGRSKEKVLGIECNELITHYSDKTFTYYFNPDSLRINAELYRNFKLTNKQFTSKKMGTLFLKCKMEYKLCTLILTAVNISHQQVDPTYFAIPRGAILVGDKL